MSLRADIKSLIELQKGGVQQLHADKTCQRCLRQLPDKAFGMLTDNNELVWVPDPICNECRQLLFQLGELEVEARRKLGRWESQNDRYLGSARNAVTEELLRLGEQPTDFRVEILAKLLVMIALEKAPIEIDLRELFQQLFADAEP